MHASKHYRTAAYAEAEKVAAAARLGLWQDAVPVAPWEWRHSKTEFGEKMSETRSAGMKPLFLLLIGQATAGFANANDIAVKKFRNFTPQQIQALPDKVKTNELPMMYTFAAQTGLAPNAALLFSLQLNQLMYAAVSDYPSAVRAFQADLGDPPNGVLTVHQIRQLEYRSDLQKLSPVSFPNDFSSWISSDSAAVKGTLTMLDEKLAWPINHHKIVCFKLQKICEVSQIMLDLPDDKSWAQRYQVMVDSTEYYDITRWTNDVIDAEYPNKPDSCRSTSVNLNFKTKEFFFITKKAGGTCEVLGTKVEKLSKPRISQIVDGKKIIDGEFARIGKMAFEALSSDFRNKAEAIQAQASKK